MREKCCDCESDRPVTKSDKWTETAILFLSSLLCTLLMVRLWAVQLKPKDSIKNDIQTDVYLHAQCSLQLRMEEWAAHAEQCGQCGQDGAETQVATWTVGLWNQHNGAPTAPWGRQPATINLKSHCKQSVLRRAIVLYIKTLVSAALGHPTFFEK